MLQHSQWTLKSNWIDDGSDTGAIGLSVWGQPGSNLPSEVKLAFTSLTRIPPGAKISNGKLVSRTANYHEMSPATSLAAAKDGLLWEVTVHTLSHQPRHYTDGPSSAFLIFPDGKTEPVRCDRFEASLPSPPSIAPIALPSVSASKPTAGLVPIAMKTAINAWLAPAPESIRAPDVGAEINTVSQLHGRLFPQARSPFSAEGTGPSLDLVPPDAQIRSLGTSAYRLDFAPDRIALMAEGEGLFYGLIALAQMWHAANGDPDQFAFPRSGHILDWPDQQWRGMHLDVSRQFYPPQSILDFLDILAWHRLNIFHWHLTDDEGWRLESKAYPNLTTVGAWRGHGMPLLPQHGSGLSSYGGFYGYEDVRTILAHADALKIEVVPEIDVPGHCYAALASVPELIDPSAFGGASVQGYVNNALNPGLNATWVFLEQIFGEVADLFPSRYVHMGGDEVADAAWSGSRSARSWAAAKGYLNAAGEPETMQMQSAILRFVADKLIASGKVPVAWEEAAKGGGLDPDTAILMAWFNAESGRRLAQTGYRIVMCPGEAYYLDMAQSKYWNEPGLSWAGTSSTEQTYQFDPAAELSGHEANILGIQGCIWSENLITRNLFNHMVFPRLSAIAESAWSGLQTKHWHDFSRRMGTMPTMPDEA